MTPQQLWQQGGGAAYPSKHEPVGDRQSSRQRTNTEPGTRRCAVESPWYLASGISRSLERQGQGQS